MKILLSLHIFIQCALLKLSKQELNKGIKTDEPIQFGYCCCLKYTNRYLHIGPIGLFLEIYLFCAHSGCAFVCWTV